MSFLSEVLNKKVTFKFDDDRHYDIFFFKNKDDFIFFKETLRQSVIRNERSTWYGNVSEVVTTHSLPKIKSILQNRQFRLYEVEKSVSYDARPIICVAPAQLITPFHIVGVFDDYFCSFCDLEKYLMHENNLFDDQNQFTIYFSVRFSQIGDKKLRRLFMNELFSAIIMAKKRFDYMKGRESFNLVMFRKDAGQTGLHEHFQHFGNRLNDISITSTDNAHDGQSNDFTEINVNISELEYYASEMAQFDPLVVDTIVYTNDLDLLDTGNVHKLKYIENNVPLSISSNRSINHHALRTALQNSDMQISNPLSPEEGQKLDEAVKQLCHLLNIVGMRFDTPVKYINHWGLNKTSHHLFKLPRTNNKNVSIFQSYERRVRHVDAGKGYKVRTFNAKYWIIFVVGIALSALYIGLRRNQRVEDILQTITALLTIFVPAGTTLVLNTVYRGEALLDIITNYRFIDTQEEFEDKPWKQTPDIIEVLRMSIVSPKFLGGCPNTSFIRKSLQNAGFQTYQSMPISNLIEAGYGLFECEKGHVYMIDPWDCLFHVHIINRHDEQRPNGDQEKQPKDENPYQVESNKCDSHISNSDCDDSLWPRLDLKKTYQSVRKKILVGVGISIWARINRFDADNTLLCTPIDVPGKRKYTHTSDNNSSRGGSSASSNPFTSLGNLGRANIEEQQPRGSENLNASISADNQRTENIEEHETGIIRRSIYKNGELEYLYLSRVLPYGSRYRLNGFANIYSQHDYYWSKFNNNDIFRMDVGIQKRNGKYSDLTDRHPGENTPERFLDLPPNSSFLRKLVRIIGYIIDDFFEESEQLSLQRYRGSLSNPSTTFIDNVRQRIEAINSTSTWNALHKIDTTIRNFFRETEGPSTQRHNV